MMMVIDEMEKKASVKKNKENNNISNIIVMAPNQIKLLKAIEALEKIDIAPIYLIGCEKEITNILKEEDIHLKTKIIDVVGENNIIEKAAEFLNKKSLIVFGEISEFYQKKLLNAPNEEVNYFFVIDLKDLRHFIFVSNHSRKRHLDFDDKKKAILAVFDFMNSLGVKKSNVAILTDKLAKTDVLEVNLIRMILKEDICKYVNVLSPCRIEEVFNKNYYNNIYDKNINMFIFKNYDITKTFIDTLGVFSNNKIASIGNLGKYIYVDALMQKNEQDILFSILLVSKYLLSVKQITKENERLLNSVCI